MRVSKYINLDANILMEYIYDDANLISEPYEILVNTKDVENSFLSTTSGSVNTLGNQLFLIDPITRTYGISDTTNYSFLQVNNYSSGYPLRYDVIVIHLPINYTFGNYIGFYLKVYGFDKNNSIPYDLCNFFFDVTNVNTKSYINYTNPPFIYNETLWGKEITILVPALNAISNQVNSNITIPNSLNFNLTNGVGMSQQSPIFFEFSFINKSQTINNVTTYLLAPKVLTNLPQVPEFQKLGVVIEPASDGDYFQIYGIYNGTIAEFNTWINNSVYLGNDYYVTYTITMYEQNIRGNSLTITVTSNFNTPIEYRPIIKYSSTTAIIDVEMNVIDAVDGSSIVRKASYGMLQDEVSKFSRYLSKINLLSASKPVIYNLKSGGAANYQVAPVNNVTTVEVPFAVLVTSANVVAQSNNSIYSGTIFYGDGKLKIVIKPFDTIVKLTIAQTVTGASASSTNNADTGSIKYMDLTPFGQIQMVFKNTQTQYSYPLYLTNGDINLQNGVVTFLIPASAVSNIRGIYQSGANVFYVTGTQQSLTTVIYSGLFDRYDSPSNINDLNTTQLQITTETPPTPPTPPTQPTSPFNKANLINKANLTALSSPKILISPTLVSKSSGNISNNLSANISNSNTTNINGSSGANSGSSGANSGTTNKPKITGSKIATVDVDNQLNYTTTIGGGTWNSSNVTVATIDSTGNNTANVGVNSSGTTTITYTAPNGNTDSIILTVKPKSSGSSGSGSGGGHKPPKIV